jgi:uncharacterized protein
MNRQHYLFRLIPPRPTFPGDITEAEGALMAHYARYTREQFEAGKILIYGPVMAKGGLRRNRYSRLPMKVKHGSSAKTIPQ